MRDLATSDNTDAAIDHVLYCWDTLISQFTKEEVPRPRFEDTVCPLFVTFSKESRSRAGDYKLRGCIGTLEARPLHQALADYTVTSAFRDRRFNPIDESEVPRLECTVSLLKNFERGKAWDDWEVGKHGIIIDFTDPDTNQHRSATFLPEVAERQGWDCRETLEHLVAKSGCSAAVSDRLLGSTAVTRYESSLLSMAFKEYRERSSLSSVKSGRFSSKRGGTGDESGQAPKQNVFDRIFSFKS